MKHFYFYLTLLFVALIGLSGCNNEWESELYTRMVSLKAPINNGEVSVIYLKYKPNNEIVTYKLPVIVSGSQKNDKNYTVRIGVDNDTLNDLNIGRYADRSDLYYRQLPENFYELPSQTCRIPAGSDVALYNVNFNFSGLDLVEKWVLPLTILPDATYTLNTYKGRQKALLWVIPFNDYSGTYSASSMSVTFAGINMRPMTANTRETRVVDENTIFFYAGITEELSEERSHFKVKCKFLDPYDVSEIIDPITGENTGFLLKKGYLELSAPEAALNFRVSGTPTYEIREELDIDRPHVVKRFYTLRMNYYYDDTISSNQVVFPYYCSGTMTMQRNVDTLVPDEDQAIYW